MIIIRGWFGRLGNNIRQLTNVIQIALYYKDTIQLPNKHPFFDVKTITNYFNNNKSHVENRCCRFNFFYKPPSHPRCSKWLKNIPTEVVDKNEKETIDLLRHAFVIDYNDVDKLSTDTVVIHIRSGDVFREHPHRGYVPPPLTYYVHLLNKHKFNKIILVCEDKINPVVDELLNLYPNAIYNTNSLEEDIKTILGATNIIYGIGTFIPTLTTISCNSLNLYHVSLYEKELQKYYLTMKPWKNTELQRNNMLEYKF